MPGTKNYSVLKGLEWLNYSIASEFEQLKEFQKKQKEESNPYVLPLFSAVVSFSVGAAVLKKVDIFQAFCISIAFLVAYVGIKCIIRPIWLHCYLWYKRQVSAIEDDKEACEARVKLFNSCISNEILLAYGFLQKAISSKNVISNKENGIDVTEKLTEFYMAEALHYIENPLVEVITIINVFYDKIIDDGKNEKLIPDKNIKLYRLLALVALMKEIVEYIENETENNLQLTVDDVFKTDLTNLRSKVLSINEKLQEKKSSG